MTSDARAIEVIQGYFSTEWPRLCPDATFAISGPPEPRDEVFVHLEIDEVSRWLHLRCWVPVLLQVDATAELHRAALAILDGASIPSDDGQVVIGAGVPREIGRNGPGRRQWMSVVSFPFRLVSGPVGDRSLNE